MGGRFVAGNPGGPGRPCRPANELRRAAEEAITPEHVQAMIRKFTRMALEGNLAAGRLVFERTCGRAAEAPVEPVEINPLRLRTAADCSVAIQRVVDGICKGTIERDVARTLIDAVQAQLKAIETTDLEARLAELEKAAGLVDFSRRS